MDVTLENSFTAHTGAQFSRWVQQKTAELPYLRPLVFLLKTLLHTRGLNVPFQGGVSSYVLTLMTSAFLKMSFQLPSVAHYFLEILRYYGEEFKSDQMMIIGGEYITIPKFISPLHTLVVVDPFTTNTNAASSVSQFQLIKELFSRTRKEIITLSEQYESKTDTRILHRVLN